jgi:hypothetical protein
MTTREQKNIHAARSCDAGVDTAAARTLGGAAYLWVPGGGVVRRLPVRGSRE